VITKTGMKVDDMVVKETRGTKTSTKPKTTTGSKVDGMVPSKAITKTGLKVFGMVVQETSGTKTSTKTKATISGKVDDMVPSKSITRTKPTSSATQGEPVALVYPFVARINIENASKGLHLGEKNTKFSLSHILQLQ
jgi:hypothetical protein